jgi:hypothetical protein
LNDLGRHLAHGIGRRPIADQAQRFCGAAFDERRRIAQSTDQRIARGRIADEAEGERRDLPDFRIRIVEQLDERRHAFRQPDAPDRQRRLPTNPRSRRVGEQSHEIGRRRRHHDHRRFLAFDGRWRRRRHRRRRIAQRALILEPQDPRRLLREGWFGRFRRRGRRRRFRGAC